MLTMMTLWLSHGTLCFERYFIITHTNLIHSPCCELKRFCLFEDEENEI